MLQQSSSAGKSCAARRAAGACTSFSRDLLGSLTAGMYTQHSGPGTAEQDVECPTTSQVGTTARGLHAGLPRSRGFLSDCLTAEEPESSSETGSSSVPVILGAPLECPPELVGGQDSNQANGRITNIPWIPWPSGCTATSRLIFQLDESNDFGSGCGCSQSLF